jgi:hypothetical protein
MNSSQKNRKQIDLGPTTSKDKETPLRNRRLLELNKRRARKFCLIKTNARSKRQAA